MKTKTTLILIVLFSINALYAQWAQKANHAGGGRGLCAAFTVGDKIYVFGGSTTTTNVYKELWEYNTVTNAWSQKADFPGGPRVASTAFAVGNKGYTGLGSDFTNYFNDLWEYDPAADSWLQKANFPGSVRQSATGMTIGNKGYLGGGLKYTGSFTLYNDFWEYDPASDAWLQKANIPGPSRSDAAACAIGNIGYFGLGTNKTNLSYNDFYAYDPAADSWTALSSPNGNATGASAMFAIGTDCYLVGGHDWSNNYTTNICQQYNTLTDTWAPVASFPGGSVYYHVAASVNGKAFVGTGGNSTLAPKKDWWLYTVPATATITSITSQNKDQVSLSIYPNPFNDQVTVSFKDAQYNDNLTFCITNVLGEQVFRSNIDNTLSPDHTLQLPAGLSSGVYSYSLINGRHANMASGKIVKE